MKKVGEKIKQIRATTQQIENTKEHTTISGADRLKAAVLHKCCADSWLIRAAAHLKVIRKIS